jgi:hypothetical protein
LLTEGDAVKDPEATVLFRSSATLTDTALDEVVRLTGELKTPVKPPVASLLVAEESIADDIEL